jgi:hypothetical protein
VVNLLLCLVQGLCEMQRVSDGRMGNLNQI